LIRTAIDNYVTEAKAKNIVPLAESPPPAEPDDVIPQTKRKPATISYR
jgi:hypothetical protein